MVDLATVSVIPVARPLTIDVGLAALFEPVPSGVRLTELVLAPDLPSFVAIDALPADQRQRVADVLRSTAPEEFGSILGRETGAGFLLRRDESWAWMVDALDIGLHPFGVDLVLDGPVGGGRSMQLWKRLLGDDVEISGPPSEHRVWQTIDGTVRATARRPGHRTAQLLGIAAGLAERDGPVLVVDAAVQREAIEPAAARVWTSVVGQFLLRPPSWPTVDEARRRLASGVARTAMVGPAAARALAEVAHHVIVARAPVPSLRHRTVARLVADDQDDPFTAVVEPLAAHLVAELLATCRPGAVAIAEPLLDTGVLADLCGRPQQRHVSEFPDNAAVTESLFAALGDPTARGRVSDRAVAAALHRLLPPGESLRPFQRDVIEDVRAGRDVLAVFRTGLGKSLCYQVPALALAELDGVTLVISPLIALQRDQLSGLRRKGVIEAAVYNSSLTADVRAGILRGTRAGFYRLLFVAPEALSGHALRQTLQDVDVALVAIDEAHCISEMGHDFRPDYRTLPQAISRVIGLPDGAGRPRDGSGPTIVALTGTANPHVIDDIQALLS